MSFSTSRIAAGLSLDDVAKELCVPLHRVQQWERGEGVPPTHISRSLSVLQSFTRHATVEPASMKGGKAGQTIAEGKVADTSSGQALLIKSKKRVADHGEVFTPDWLVEKMLDLVKGETERIDSRFLEPACGSGNFLVPILQRKLAAVEAKYGKSDFEKRQYALLALTCCYGIELLPDNIAECRANMLEVFAEYLGLSGSDELYRAGSYVLSLNLIHGDAMSTQAADGGPITVAEWSYLGKGKFNRRDFRLDVLTGASGFSKRWAEPEREEEVSLFNEPRPAFHQRGRDPIFVPIRDYPPLKVRDLAALDVESAA